jgi:hypothetical protein
VGGRLCGKFRKKGGNGGDQRIICFSPSHFPFFLPEFLPKEGFSFTFSHPILADRDEFGKLLSTTDRLSQSSLASPKGRQLGSDMVEHRRVLSSPPFVAISAHPTNSLVPFEKPSSAMSGQMMHHTNTSGSSASPMASGGSLISVHEVPLKHRIKLFLTVAHKEATNFGRRYSNQMF